MKDDPDVCHSEFIVKVLGKNEVIEARDLIRYARLAIDTVKKFVFYSHDDQNESPHLYCIEWTTWS